MAGRGGPVRPNPLDVDGDGDVDADDAVKLLTDLVEQLAESLGHIEPHSIGKSLIRRIRRKLANL